MPPLAVAIAVPLVVPFVSFVVNKLGDYLLSRASDRGGFWVAIERMKRELEAMKAFLEEAAAEHNNSPVWINLAKNIGDVAYTIQDVHEKYLHYSRYSTVPDITLEISNIDHMIQMIKGQIATYRVPRGEGRVINMLSPTQFPSRDNTKGLEKEKEMLVQQLMNAGEHRCVFSIVGMGGLGKSALANHVYQKIKNEFQKPHWVTVSAAPNINEILRDINENIGNNENVSWKKWFLGLLKRNKKKGYLLVLDDIWDRAVWDQIETAIPNDRNGSRVLLTTRSIHVANIADETHRHMLRFLNETESRDVFLMSVPNQDYLDPELVKRCHDLPLALVKLGRHLSTEEMDPVEGEGMSTTLNWQASEDLRQCLQRLGLSYKFLPYHLKPFLLYLTLFPKSSRISTKRLIRLWMSEKLITSGEGANLILKELIKRCMIYVVEKRYDRSVKYVYIHEILREALLWEAGTDGFIHIVEENPNAGNAEEFLRIRHLAVNNQIPRSYRDPDTSQWRTQQLHTLLGFNLEAENNVNGISFGGLELLRVIDLQDVTALQTLPEEVKRMFLLRYLRIRGSSDRQHLILDIKSLYNLQMLDDNRGALARSFCTASSSRLLQLLKHMKAGNWIVNLERLPNLNQLGIKDLQSEHGLDLIRSLRRLEQLKHLTLESRDDSQSLPKEVLELPELISLKLKGTLSTMNSELPKKSWAKKKMGRVTQEEAGISDE